MRARYEHVASMGDVARQVEKLSARTIILDVEPLVAYWDGERTELDQGIARVLDEVGAIPGLQVVCFATNSSRRPSALPDLPHVRVVYLASAGKPLRTAPYQGFPRPGVVVGDQVVTDGILARRLGYTFVLAGTPAGAVPLGPRLMGAWGQVVRPLLFRGPASHPPREAHGNHPPRG